jgi:hypothetical protein
MTALKELGEIDTTFREFYGSLSAIMRGVPAGLRPSLLRHLQPILPDIEASVNIGNRLEGKSPVKVGISDDLRRHSETSSYGIGP